MFQVVTVQQELAAVLQGSDASLAPGPALETPVQKVCVDADTGYCWNRLYQAEFVTSDFTRLSRRSCSGARIMLVGLAPLKPLLEGAANARPLLLLLHCSNPGGASALLWTSVWQHCLRASMPPGSDLGGAPFYLKRLSLFRCPCPRVMLNQPGVPAL